MKSVVSFPPEKAAPRMSFPFLHRGPTGCVYLRCQDGVDVIVAPATEKNIGKVIPSQYDRTHEQAWRNKLPEGASVTLTQVFKEDC